MPIVRRAPWRLLAVLSLTLSVTILTISPAPAATVEGWRSPLAGRELVLIDKVPFGDVEEPQLLPFSVASLLGGDFVEYESLVAARLPAAEAASLTSLALQEGLFAYEDPKLPGVLPFMEFDLSKPEARTAPWAGNAVKPLPVPRLFLVHFAFPILESWLDGLRACGAEPLLYYGNGVFSMRAQNLTVFQSCAAAAPYLAWVEPFLTTDRTSPELLATAGLEKEVYSLVFAPGTELEKALAELPAGMDAGDNMVWEDGSLSLGVLAGAPELVALLETSESLLAIHPAGGAAELSDERQGLIIAGKYAGYPGALSGAVTTPGYYEFLKSRGLDTLANLPAVAVFDTGYDDGLPDTAPHHPEMENLVERLLPGDLNLGNFVFSPVTPRIDDASGHGTFVASIITGGLVPPLTQTGLLDAQGFRLGLGIAPGAKIVPVQLFDRFLNSQGECRDRNGLGDVPPDNLGRAITFSRVTTTGADKALIANHSWNINRNTYADISQLLDARVIDANPPAGNGLQAMLMVVAAGNKGASGPGFVLAPATAKNVLSVGSCQSYRPSTQAPPNSCSISFPAEYTREANDIAKISAFSSQGPLFGRKGLNQPLVHKTRILPTVVAPGGKVFGITPYFRSTYVCPALCHVSWPVGSAYTYASGTSFAAPVVSGMAALLRKWFIGRGLMNPAPTLLKASIIATATDLGPALDGDHRPSNKQGFGRVSLERATDPAVARFYLNENGSFAVAMGVERSWTRTIGDPGKDTYIVLAWNDPASPQTGSHPPVVNDLSLRVDRVGGNVSWHGNNFRENVVGIDDGNSHAYSTAAQPLVDAMNNVEAIFIPAGTLPSGSQVRIRVKGLQVPQGSQKFSLYAYNVEPGS